MKVSTTFLVAVLAIVATSATEQQGKVGAPAGPPGKHPHPKVEARQGRGIDFLGPFRSIFGSRPRGQSGGKQYGVKPSETQSKPNTATPYDTQGSFKPNFPNFNEGFGSEFGPPSPPAHGGRPLRQLHKYPAPQGPHGGPPGGPHGGPPGGPHGGPPGGPHGGPPGGPHGGPPGGPHGGPPGGPHGGPNAQGGHFGFQQAPQHTYHTYAEPQLKHHHYHSFMPTHGQQEHNENQQGQEQYNNEISKPAPQYNDVPQGPASYDAQKATPLPYDGPKVGPYETQSQYDGQSQNYYPQQQSYDSPQPAPQSNRPVSQPSPAGFEQQNNGFADFGGFGPSSFGQGPASQGDGQGGFFGGAQNYPEQYEEQTRNTREPEIITADYQNQGQGQGPEPFHGGYQAGPQGAPSYPQAEAYSGPQPSNAPHGSGPIIKSHPLRASAAGHGRPRFGAPPPSYGNQGESRPQPFLYRPVSSSIRVPGAVDEDAVYGKPMMMSASNKKPLSAKFRSGPHPQPSKARPVYKSPPTIAPFLKPDGVVTLESPRDPQMRHSASVQNGMVVEPDTAATGHHHGHHGHGHEMESANGDRILYHVAGHQGPYSYRFGYDTGKGYNRMFRFEEKDGKGYVTGKYGFYDKHGKLNVVNYQAHPEHGYHAERDHGNHHQTHTIKH